MRKERNGWINLEMCKKSPDQWKDGCMIFARCKKPWSMKKMDVLYSRNAKESPDRWKDECKIFAECEKALINGKMDDIREIQKALINQWWL